MEQKYNAFISYRHSEQDSKIASEIQTTLERFKIPKEIQKKTGVKRFERIFRDKEELPITSDLNDDIEIALKESDHLIVICSERTSESIWVQKEIETFLKYHTKKNIFTVLVDGDPGKVIPDILLHDKVTRKMADGRIETREELIEPLSCDYRLGIKKARKVELPRLAASMLGCSYDELIQRRRQYIRRRNAMIISCASIVLAGIIAYLCWSLVQINKNYELAQANYRLARENYDTAQINYMESLSNQSRYLAAESAVLLAGDDRVGATQLAIAALPGENDDRPLTSQAIYALHNALGTYIVPGYSDIAPVWKYSTGQKIQKYDVSSDQRTLAAMDESGTISVWNLLDHSLIRTFDASSIKIKDMVYSSDSELIISGEDELTLFNADYSEAKWSIEINGKYDHGDILKLSDDGSELIYLENDEISIIDVSNGNIKETHVPEEEIILPEDEKAGSTLRAMLDPTGRYLEVECLSWMDYRVYVYDRQEKNWIITPDISSYILGRTFDDEGIMIASIDDSMTSSSSLGNLVTLSENNCIISKYSLQDGSLLWRCSIPYTMIGYESKLSLVNIGPEDDKTECVGAFFSNRCVFVETKTREIITVKELPSEFIDAFVLSSGKAMYCLLRSGQYLYISLTEPDRAMGAYSYFNDNIEDSVLYRNEHTGNAYLIEYSAKDCLIEYSANYYDKSFDPVDGMDTGLSVQDVLYADGNVILMCNNMKMYCYNSSYGHIVWNKDVDGSYYTGVDLLAYDGKGSVYLLNDNIFEDGSGPKIYKFNLSDGEGEYVKDFPDFMSSSLTCTENAIWVPYRAGFGSEDSDGIYRYDLGSGEISFTEITGDMPDSMYSTRLNVSPDEKNVIMTCGYDDVKVYLADLKKGTSCLFDSDYSGFAVWSTDSSAFALGDETGFAVYDTKGKELFREQSGENKLTSVYLNEEYVVSVDSYGYVSFYDYKGNLISSCEIMVFSTFGSDDTTFEIYGDTMIINSGSLGNVIDLADYKPLSIVTGYLAYLEADGKYLVKTYSPSENEPSVGVFIKKDVDYLINQGNEYLTEANITDEMKNRYGF